jgi:hypothetical protein
MQLQTGKAINSLKQENKAKEQYKADVTLGDHAGVPRPSKTQAITDHKSRSGLKLYVYFIFYIFGNLFTIQH